MRASTEEEESTTRIHYRCLICGASRSKRSLILSHMQKSHPLTPSEFSIAGKDRRIYKCIICGDSRSRISLIQKHMQVAHSIPLQTNESPVIGQNSPPVPGTFEGEECDRLAEKPPSLLRQHCLAHTVEESTTCRHYRCLICSASRTKHSLILSHMQKSHPLSPSEFLVVGKDRRIYECYICGDSRSKLSLLQKHLQVAHSSHLETRESPVTGKNSLPVPGTKKRKALECDECGRLAKKPSLLRQHGLVHTLERPFVCPKDGCGKCYKNPCHLKRHLLHHEQMACLCPQPGCIEVCSNQSCLSRHLQRHDIKGDVQRGTVDAKKVLKCPEPGCSATFPYPCRLQQHADIVHGLSYADIRCGEPGCGKSFTSAKFLLQHIRHFHSRVVCQICGVSVSRKSFKRHAVGHETCDVKQRLFCPFDGCTHSFANSSNLSVHIRVRHFGRKEYCCRYDGCGKAFGYRHTRDNHESRGFHAYVPGDFKEEDIKFQARWRGGRKPLTLLKVEDLFRKRVMCVGGAF
ncbi:hypothetical protein GOP47_0012405 [Adiantum capillus-veneris]|uniref:C2H2-type domain-containing protein n=1 Tax=Adiantum capillus-veneris TaxID=13818 RepID=A0A9D4UR37_ADICA|nr:hypothetical protein GOP47_0012405 [Adiantum capillus-veneris]